MTIYFRALTDLLCRYGEAFRTAWSMRETLDGGHRSVDEIDFLPSQLELVERPPHPAPRWALRMLCALSAAIVLACAFGRLDIVATAKGKVLPSQRVKVIQPAITGVARSILVHDGQRVMAGERLIELDTTQAAADSDRARKDRINAELAIASAQATLHAQAVGGVPIVAAVTGASADDQRQAQALADSIVKEVQAKVSSATAEYQKRIAERATADAEVQKLAATTPLARREADDYRNLASEKYVSEHDYLDKEQKALVSEHDLVAQRSHSNELAAAIAEQRADIATTVATFRKEQLDKLTKAEQELQHSSDEETKATTREGLLSLTAPVSGTVQQLSVHTLGGVVTTAQQLMVIVPDDALEVEANIENKDIGFVKPGQAANVKIDAFPYTEYGIFKGQVVSVSNDAVPDKRLGLVFKARIRLPGNSVFVGGKSISITPGMQVTTDILTGKRSVAAYFLTPLMESAQEGLRER